MYVDNLVSGFYNIIAKKKVLIYVNYDIDAICAAKILQDIFRHDSISYTLIPVCTISDLIKSYQEHRQDMKHIILINCGGTIDIVDTLEIEPDATFFIADSHRPTDVCNIYSLEHIRILNKTKEEENVPQYDDIFRDDLDESGDIEDSDDENDDPEEEAGRKHEERVALKEWKKNRKRIYDEYIQFSYYGRSTAILMYELSWQLHRENVDLLWWGIVGVVEQFILSKAVIVQYTEEVERISSHIGRLCPPVHDSSNNLSQNSSFISSQTASTCSNLRINIESDLQLALYRHWTVENSLKYTMCTAVALRLFEFQGEKRLYRLLAEMGMPLADSRQQYYSMDLSLRKEFHSMIEKISSGRWNLEHITYPSFTLLHGFRTKYQAADYVYSLLALLSNIVRGRSIRDCFYDAMDALSRTKKKLLDDGIEKAKKFLTIMFRQVQNAIDMKQVISAGQFYYFVIQEGTANTRYYTNPDCLWLLAIFVLRAYVRHSNRNEAARKPLIASVPLDESYCLMIGIPPVNETTPRSFFGQAFLQAAKQANCNIEPDYFDSTVVRIPFADRPKMFDALANLLEESDGENDEL